MKNRLHGHRERLTSLKFINHDQLLISASSQEDHVCSWDVVTGTLLHTIRIEGVRDVNGSPHHSFFIADGKPRLRNSDGLYLRTAFVCDAKHGTLSELVGAGKAAVFTSNGCVIITTRYGDEKNLDVHELQPAVGRLGLVSEHKVLPEDGISPISSLFENPPEVNGLLAPLRRR